MTRNLVAVLALGALVACGGKSSNSATDAGQADAGPTFIDGFNPAPAPAGYTRFVTPVIDDIQPMDGTLWCQWIAGPSAQDVNVVDVKGEQSKYGHHVVLYATTTNEPVGTSRPCTNADMVSVRYLGGIGGEGSGGLSALPSGVVLRLPQGQSLLANVHFLNLGQTAIQGQAVLDVKFDQPNANERVAGFFNNTALTFNVPANEQGQLDLTCPIGADMNVFMFANHMHNYGVTAVSEVDRADGGSTDTLVTDNTWDPEEQFNPAWQHWDVAAPFVLHAGDTLHTRCTWNNTTSAALAFPTEMCVGMGFFLPPGGTDGQDIYCVDRQWSVGSPP